MKEEKRIEIVIDEKGLPLFNFGEDDAAILIGCHTPVELLDENRRDDRRRFLYEKIKKHAEGHNLKMVEIPATEHHKKILELIIKNKMK